MRPRRDGWPDKKWDGPLWPKPHTHHSPQSCHWNNLTITVLLRRGLFLPSNRCCKSGKGDRTRCFNALEQELWYHLVLCDNRVDFHRLRPPKQYRPVLSPGLPGSQFHNSSNHNFPSVLHWFCRIKQSVPKMFSQTDCQCHPRPFQISVHKEALTSAPGVFFYVSVLEDSSWCLVMVYCAEGSAPPWQSGTRLSWFILGTRGLIWCHKTADQLYPWRTTASLSLIKETKAIYTLYHL